MVEKRGVRNDSRILQKLESWCETLVQRQEASENNRVVAPASVRLMVGNAFAQRREKKQ
jgi:hypothetical protein